MTPHEHLDALITSAYLNDPDDRVYRALMAQRDVMIEERDKEMGRRKRFIEKWNSIPRPLRCL